MAPRQPAAPPSASFPALTAPRATPHLTISVPTGLGQGRNLLLVRSSNALIAVGGGFGTLSEIALALRTGTPVIGLATWSLHLDGRPVDAFPVASDPDTAARLALRNRHFTNQVAQPGDRPPRPVSRPLSSSYWDRSTRPAGAGGCLPRLVARVAGQLVKRRPEP